MAGSVGILDFTVSDRRSTRVYPIPATVRFEESW